MKHALGYAVLCLGLTGALLLQLGAGQVPPPEEQVVQAVLSAIATLNTLDQEAHQARLTHKPQDAPLGDLMTRYQAMVTQLDQTTAPLHQAARRPEVVSLALQVRDLRREALRKIEQLHEQQETLRMIGGPRKRSTP